MQQFIRSTRGIKYSDFIYGRSSHKYMINDDGNSIDYDFKFSNCIYIKIPRLNNANVKKINRILTNNLRKDNLIIDLRGSTGGYIEACADLCQMLLPECEIFTNNYRNKKTIYYSDEAQIKFDNIFVFVNEHTASSSEILALALKKKLNNCFILGNETTQKQYGQDYIHNKKYKFTLITTSFMWTVGGEGASDLNKCIIPSSYHEKYYNDDDYFGSLRNLLKLRS